MIRILHIVHSMGQGGIENLLMNLYRSINKQKVQFDFLVCEKGLYDEEITSLGGIVYYYPSRSKDYVANRKALDEFFKKHTEYQIVHFHVSSLSYVTPLVYARKNGVKHRIIHSHDTRCGGKKINYLFHYMNRLHVKKLANHYFACSEKAGKWLYGEKSIMGEDYMFFPNAIELKKFQFSLENRSSVRKELGLNETDFVIGNVGRLAEQKNQARAIEIFKELLSYKENAKLLIIGSGVLEEELKNQIKENRLEEKVLLLGNRQDVYKIISAMDCFLMPSLHEGFPVTLVEAQANGVPCVVSSEITREVKLNENVAFVDLKAENSCWISEIFNQKRCDGGKLNMSYEISSAAEQLVEFYATIK